MKRILIIDDEQIVVNAMKDVLNGLGNETTTTTSANEGEQLATSQDFDLLLIDLMMPECNGAELTRRILSKKPDMPILVITGHPHDPLAGEALKAGAKSLVGKPFEIGKIMDFVEKT